METERVSRTISRAGLVILLRLWLEFAAGFELEAASCERRNSIFLVHTPRCIWDLSFVPTSADVLQLVTEDQDRDCPKAVSLIPGSGENLTRTEVRNQLYAEATKLEYFKSYLYLVMIDADFDLEAMDCDLPGGDNPWPLFLETVFAMEPAVAVPARVEEASTELEVQTPLRIRQGIIVVHREARRLLLPYQDFGNEEAEALFESIATAAYSGHVLQVNSVKLRARESTSDAASVSPLWLTRFAAGAMRRLDDFLRLQGVCAACGRDDPEAPRRRAAGPAHQYEVVSAGVFDACHEVMPPPCEDAAMARRSSWMCFGPAHPDCTPSPLRAQEKLLLFLQELNTVLHSLSAQRGGLQPSACAAHVHPVQLQISHPQSSDIVRRSDGVRFHGVVAGLPRFTGEFCDGFGVRVWLPEERFTMLPNPQSQHIRGMPPVEWYCAPPEVVGVREFKANFADVPLGVHSFVARAVWCPDAGRCGRPGHEEYDSSGCEDVGGLQTEARTRFRVVADADVVRVATGEEAKDTASREAEEADTDELLFVYLVQSDTCLDLSHLKSLRSAVIQLTWKEPPGASCADKDAIYLPRSSLVQGRNRLYREVGARHPGRDFLYVVLMDGDVTLVEVADFGGNSGDAWRTFEEYLLQWEPAVGFPHFGGMDYDPTREVQLAYNFDQIVVAYHRDACPLLLPYSEAFDHLSWWYCGAVQNALIAAGYNQHRVQFNALRALSWGSNPSPTYKRGSNFNHPLAWVSAAIRSFDALMRIPFHSPHQQATASVWDTEAGAWTTSGHPQRKGTASYVLDSESRALFDFCHEYFEDRTLSTLCDPQAPRATTIEEAVLLHLKELEGRVERFGSTPGLSAPLQQNASVLMRRVQRFQCAVRTLHATAEEEAGEGAASTSPPPPEAAAPSTTATASDPFERYIKVVCDKCALRGEDCGCERGSGNPPFQVLRAYATKYAEWAKERQACGDGCARVSFNWVVVPASGGLGNQLLQLGNGLLFAIATGRALAVGHGERIAGQKHDFEFDSVIPFMAGDRAPRVLRPVNFDSLDQIMCGNWELELAGHDVEMLLGQPPSLFLANPLYGDELRDAFLGRPFFFLSHFLWTGEASLRTAVQVQSLPAPLAWDGPQLLGSFLARLRAAAPLSVIGAHVRIAGHKREFAHFDHRRLSNDDIGGEGAEARHRAFCGGHPASLSDVSGCLASLIESVRADGAGGDQNRSSTAWNDVGGSVVVLWSCDRDDLSIDLLSSVVAWRGVHVVRLVHGDDGFRHDAWPETALLDMALLEGSHRFVGSTGSTFSFAAHARGLIPPHYPSFRAHRAQPCGLQAKPEGGLLYKGFFHDQCSLDRNGSFTCRASRHDCLTTISAGIELGASCLQAWAACLDGDTSWADDFLLDVDHAYFGAQYLLRVSDAARFVAASGEQLQGCKRDAPPAAPSAEAPSPWTRFALYRKTVCAKCDRRGVECGCDLGVHSPPFQHLHSFISRMLADELVAGSSSLKWISVRLSGGVGNQLLQAVTGLLLALATHRGLAVKLDGTALSAFDSVLELPRHDELLRLGLRERPHPLEVAPDTLEMFMCGDVDAELSQWDVVEVCFGQPPHLLLANPLYSALVRDDFMDRPFFFLSHFFLVGADTLRRPVRVHTAPRKAVWDAAHTLGDFADLLVGTRPRRVVGVHVRVHSHVAFEHFDHRNTALTGTHAGGDESWDGNSFCAGDRRSLNDISACVQEFVHDTGDADTSQLGAVVVLWATDNDELTSELRDALLSSGVLLVQLEHSKVERSDTLSSGLVDLAFLELADAMVGTLASTFSFAAHARSLATPYYPAFRMDTSRRCGRAAGSEAGLIARAATHDGCVRGHDSITCRRVRNDCVQLIMWDGLPGVCLQDVAFCREGDTSWADPYLVDADHAAYVEQFNARHGRPLRTPWRREAPACGEKPDQPVDAGSKSYGEAKASASTRNYPPPGEAPFTGTDSTSDSRSSEARWEERFARFKSVVCGKCARRGRECGCEAGGGGGRWLAALWEYCGEYQRWVKGAGREAGVKWVLVPAMGGHSNQVLQLVNGLLLALATGRALAVDWGGRDAGEENHRYAFDGVLHWMTKDAIPRESLARSMAVGWKRADVQDIMCWDWDWDLEHFDVVEICLSQPPQLLLANPVLGRELNATLEGLPVFFVSHFVWSGDVERGTRVQIETLPRAQAWDGEQALGGFFRQLTAAAPRRVVGMHTRVDGFGKEFVFFDHAEHLQAGEDWRDAFCNGDAASLRDLSGCVAELVAEAEDESAGGEKGSVVVLWAADRDDLTRGLLRTVASIRGVHLVRVQYGQARRYDSLPWAALVDMVLLEEAEVVVGSLGSTFSFAAHARGLAAGLYPAFRRNRSTACGAAASSEGGLLVHTTTHDGCRIDHAARRIVCARLRGECVAAVQAGVEAEACLQDLAPCLHGDTSWADAVLVDARHVAFSAQYWARHGYEMVVNGTILTPECAPRTSKDFRADEIAPVRRAFEAFKSGVCGKCARRGRECGCEAGGGGGRWLAALWEYCGEYQRWVKGAGREAGVKWVLVPAMGGHSNQVLQLVNGLLLALATGRALAVDWGGRDAGEENHRYAFDGVLHWMTKDAIPRESLARRKILKSKDVESAGEGADLEHFDVVEICLSQPPQLLLANPILGRELNATLEGLPVFFVSHFVWSGDVERGTRVRIETLPRAQAWDGEQALGGFFRQLTAASPRQVLGAAMRGEGRREDSAHGGAGEGATRCDAEEQNFEEVWGQVERLAGEHRAAGLGEAEGVGDALGVGGDMVVLWAASAAEECELSQALLQRLPAQTGLHVVQVAHGRGQRYDSLPWAEQVDMVLLEEAEAVVGATSAFSWALRSRGLISPLRESERAALVLGSGGGVRNGFGGAGDEGADVGDTTDSEGGDPSGCAPTAADTHAGSWVPDPDFCAKQPQNHTCLPHSTLRWRPADEQCDLRFHDAASACEMLAATGVSKVVLAGDSTMRNIFAALSLILTDDYQDGAYPARTHPPECSGPGQFFSNCKSYMTSYDAERFWEVGGATRVFCGGALTVSLIDNCLAVPSLLDMARHDVTFWGLGLHNADRWKRSPLYDCMDPNVYSLWLSTVAAAHKCVWLLEWDDCVAHGPASSDVCHVASRVIGARGEFWHQTCGAAGFDPRSLSALVWVPVHVPPPDWLMDYPYEYRTFALEAWQALNRWGLENLHYFDNVGITASTPVDAEASSGTHGVHYGTAVNLVKANLLLDLIAKAAGSSNGDGNRSVTHSGAVGRRSAGDGATPATGHPRFDEYMRQVCAKCQPHHGSECRACAGGASELLPPFSVLHDYVKRYDAWRVDYARAKRTRHQWIVADISSLDPLHKQLEQATCPLLLALLLGRPLVLNSDSRQPERFHLYRFFKSVVSWFDFSDVARLGLPRAQDSLVLSAAADGIRTLSCASIDELGRYDLIRFKEGFDPGVLYRNDHLRPSLESTFGATPSFWVSHLFQSGARILDAAVRIGAVPADHVLVALHRFSALARKVQEHARTGMVVSVYVDSRWPHDTRGGLPAAPAPLNSSVCSAVGKCLQTMLLEASPQPAVLVLLGTGVEVDDKRREQLAACLAEQTQSAVAFARWEHRHDATKPDRSAHFAMLEAELLGLGASFISSSHSPASVFVHSRARRAPFLLDPHQPDTCRLAASSESGSALPGVHQPHYNCEE